MATAPPNQNLTRTANPAAALLRLLHEDLGLSWLQVGRAIALVDRCIDAAVELELVRRGQDDKVELLAARCHLFYRRLGGHEASLGYFRGRVALAAGRAV